MFFHHCICKIHIYIWKTTANVHVWQHSTGLTRTTWKIRKVLGLRWSIEKRFCASPAEGERKPAISIHHAVCVSWPCGPARVSPLRPSRLNERDIFTIIFLIVQVHGLRNSCTVKRPRLRWSGETHGGCISVMYYHGPHYPTIWTAVPFEVKMRPIGGEAAAGAALPFWIMTRDCGGEAGEQTSHTFLAHLHVRGVCAVHRRRRHYVFPAWAAEERRLKSTRRKVSDSIMRCEVKRVGSSSSSRLRFFSYTRNEISKYSGRKGVYLIYFYLQSGKV